MRRIEVLVIIIISAWLSCLQEVIKSSLAADIFHILKGKIRVGFLSFFLSFFFSFFFFFLSCLNERLSGSEFLETKTQGD